MTLELLAALGAGAALGWGLSAYAYRNRIRDETQATDIATKKAYNLANELSRLADHESKITTELREEKSLRKTASDARDSMKDDRDKMSKDLAKYKAYFDAMSQSWKQVIIKRVKKQESAKNG